MVDISVRRAAAIHIDGELVMVDIIVRCAASIHTLISLLDVLQLFIPMMSISLSDVLTLFMPMMSISLLEGHAIDYYYFMAQIEQFMKLHCCACVLVNIDSRHES